MLGTLGTAYTASETVVLVAPTTSRGLLVSNKRYFRSRPEDVIERSILMTVI